MLHAEPASVSGYGRGMHAQGGAQIRVEGISERDEVGELAKLATFLGYRLELIPPTEAAEAGSDSTVAFLGHKLTDRWLTDLAASVVAVESVTRDLAVDTVLEQVRKKIEGWHFGPMDRKPSDNRPFGAGHVEGH